MNRTDFGKLVASLRREFKDHDDRSWCQKRLADETGLGEAVIGKIERGQRINLDPDTLSRLANALQLTSGERREFFLAAVGVEGQQMVRSERNPADVLNEMIQMIEGIQFPAFIIDAYGDFVAAKNSMIRLFEIPPDMVATAVTKPAGFNLMRLIFAPEFHSIHSIFGQQWQRTAVYNMEFFRCITLRYRFTDYFMQTVWQLRKYPLFRQFWQQVQFTQDDYCLNGEYYRYQNPKYGHPEYFATLSTGLTTSGELYLVTYLPANGRTTEVFASLAEHDGNAALRLAPWPKKAAQRDTVLASDSRSTSSR